LGAWREVIVSRATVYVAIQQRRCNATFRPCNAVLFFEEFGMTKIFSFIGGLGWLQKTGLAIVVLIVIVVVGSISFGFYFVKNQPKAEFWESEIVKFEALDKENPPAPGQVLFIGSSSFRFWGSLAEDMAPLPILNRGFGGSNLSHATYYADRIIFPYQPAAIVLYAGDNDFSGFEPSSANDVFEDFKEFVSVMRTELPDTPIYYVSIKPSKLRWKSWPGMRDANALISAFSDTDESVHFIDITDTILDDSGALMDDVFTFDGLHLNETGYARWTDKIKPVLMRDLKEIVEDAASGP
jgi:lysophospholipase L1-like esterase